MSNKRLYSIRGAVCTQNTATAIQECVQELCSTIFKNHAIVAEDIVNIQFTLTPDLTALNPATALRKSDVGLNTAYIPLFCTQEATVDGMLPRVIRIMITAYLAEGSTITPVYLHGAEALRPDVRREES